MNDPLRRLAELLQDMQRKRGWSPEDLVAKAELSPEELRAYESDAASLSPTTAMKILVAMTEEEPAESFADSPDWQSSPPQWLYDQMEAKMKELEAALRIDEGRFREALILLDRALSLDSRRERRGRLLLSKAAVLGELHRKESALQALAQAEACLDRVEEPALWMRLRLEQVYFLCQSQRHHEAAPWLEEARELAARIGRDRERLQARLLGGWIAAASERSAEALEMLRGVAEELLAAHRVFDATAVEIDVAGLLAGMGRQTEVIELAGRLEARTVRIPPQARTPLKVFCRLAQRGTLTADMARRLGTELRVAGGRLTRPYEIPI